MSDLSVSSVVSALLRHREDFSRVYEIATQLFSAPDAATAVSLAGDLLKAIAPVVQDLLGQGAAPSGLMMEEVPHTEICAAMGWDLSVVERIAGIVVKLLPLLVLI